MSGNLPASTPARWCPICGGDALLVGEIVSPYSFRTFALARCSRCSYAFVLDPRTDFAELYDEKYYSGLGVDPLVDYEREMDDARTVRTYEWDGIVDIVSGLTELSRRTRWLDYGGGLGGLVRHVRDVVDCEIVGFEEGYAVERMRDRGIEHVNRAELDELDRSFDVVTAIEVLEHSVDPLEVLRDVLRVLAPGGVLFLTTGNAAPHRNRLARWSYAGVPDVHVGFFEPTTMAGALEAAGFEVLWPGFVPGFEQVIRYKVLKTARIHRRNIVERALPWGSVARMVDRRHHVTAMPAARRPSD
jgi:SAM-dependent methyltransferase